MFVGKLVFAQLMDFLPLHTFRRRGARYPSSMELHQPIDLQCNIRTLCWAIPYREASVRVTFCGRNGHAAN
jgi:hypothetical protein